MNDNINLGISRKCGCCGEILYINKASIDNAIYYDKKTYHSSCFIKMCNKRSKSKREDISKKWTQILEHLESIKHKSNGYLSTVIVKNDIFEFIKDAYDITIVPTTVWQKLGKIYSGLYPGMSNGIPPEHILDMWKRKINMLNSIAAQNIIKGKIMSTEQRIIYDLSILINKYDGYLKWIEKQKVIETENCKLKNSDVITRLIYENKIGYEKDQREQRDDSISELVDDIFEN